MQFVVVYDCSTSVGPDSRTNSVPMDGHGNIGGQYILDSMHGRMHAHVRYLLERGSCVCTVCGWRVVGDRSHRDARYLFAGPTTITNNAYSRIFVGNLVIV